MLSPQQGFDSEWKPLNVATLEILKTSIHKILHGPL